MLMKMHQAMFGSTLFIGSMICISADSLFTAWLGLEINLMSMIPLMLIKLNKKMTEAAIKYFMAQAMASLMLIICVLMNFLTNESMEIESMEFLILCSLLIKLGAAPLHYWFPQVIELSNWTQCIVLMTWQKIAPFILIMAIMNNVLPMVSAASAILGSLGGINQNKMKLILTYSSISHTGWMLISCYLSSILWTLYFVVYSILVVTIINLVNNSFNFNSIYDMNSWSSNKWMKSILIMNMLSLGGLPPLLGFVSKLIIIKMMIKMNLIMLILFLISASLISLYFYCRIIYSSLLINNNKNLMKKKYANFNSTWMTWAVSFNILIPTMFII